MLLKAYLAICVSLLFVFGYAQYQGLSLFGGDGSNTRDHAGMGSAVMVSHISHK